MAAWTGVVVPCEFVTFCAHGQDVLPFAWSGSVAGRFFRRSQLRLVAVGRKKNPRDRALSKVLGQFLHAFLLVSPSFLSRQVFTLGECSARRMRQG